MHIEFFGQGVIIKDGAGAVWLSAQEMLSLHEWVRTHSDSLYMKAQEAERAVVDCQSSYSQRSDFQMKGEIDGKRRPYDALDRA